MRIVRLQIERFRSIRSATFFPGAHNVYLGPNNLGKTAVLEALNLLLNPEIGGRGPVVDENDFHCREYRVPASGVPVGPVGGAAPSAVTPLSASVDNAAETPGEAIAPEAPEAAGAADGSGAPADPGVEADDGTPGAAATA
ncbi:MAG: hypothetical protein QME96_12045, partial [Myxococcota bacterium]|nr:hypothetical protein [Myxococcota bacterium]